MAPSARAAWTTLTSLDAWAERLRAAAAELAPEDAIAAGWLEGAATLLARDAPARLETLRAARRLPALAAESRAHALALLGAWVDALEALRVAVGALERDRGPLVEALFPDFRPAPLRRNPDAADGADAELRRRLGTAYVQRRLGDPATTAALASPLATLEAAREAWRAERDARPLSPEEAEVRTAALLNAADAAERALDRVRWVVRGALAERPALHDRVLGKRPRGEAAAHPTADGAGAGGEGAALDEGSEAGVGAAAGEGGAPEARSAADASSTLPGGAPPHPTTTPEDGTSAPEDAATDARRALAGDAATAGGAIGAEVLAGDLEIPPAGAGPGTAEDETSAPAVSPTRRRRPKPR